MVCRLRRGIFLACILSSNLLNQSNADTLGRLVYSTTVPGDVTAFHLGGRDVITGAESTVLEAGETYEIRLTAFNELGAGEVSDIVEVGPLHDMEPDAPTMVDVSAVSDDTLRVDFETPVLDGGSSIESYTVEYDTSSDFDRSPHSVVVPVVREKQIVVVESPDVQTEVQAIRATVDVTNEVQSIRSTVTGVDEVQVVTTTADDVIAEVQTITTTAVDTDEEQTITVIADDVDEIQLVRTYGNDIPEIQEVTVSVSRVNEVQKLGIVISNINTDGDNVDSTACYGINVGEPCQDIEDALSGTFTVSFDFDDCGGSGSANYCQEAVSQYEPSAGIISCTPGLVSSPTTGGDHCVSAPVSLTSISTVEGDVGTLQKAINEMIDDNGVSFMTLGSMPDKQTAVSVTRTSRIKTKGTCTLDVGGGPATCSGEYEILYDIEFDAFHSSGDVPPLTIANSGIVIDTSSTSYTTTMCPSAYYINGCVSPTGSAADSNYGNFYENSASDTAIESVKGSQPSGMISLDYECESSVTTLAGGFTMSTSASGLEATFDDTTFTDGVVEGQHVRFSSGDGIDHYRMIVAINDGTDELTFDSVAPVETDYSDVEYGYYYSDWDESDGTATGVSSQCLASRIHTTLPIDVGTELASISSSDWEGKLGGLSVIDSTGIVVSRSPVADLSADVGFVWRITFEKQPGSVNEMKCLTVSGGADCSVSTAQESSMIGGDFALSTTWPHEYEIETPGLYSSNSLEANIGASTLKQELESIVDGGGIDRVFGTVNVVRTPYVPSDQIRWSGGYTWMITFASRGGNIPALGTDDTNLLGSGVQLEISDEDSGASDTFQGSANSASFTIDDLGTARDGNQVSGSFALSWDGNLRHGAVTSSSVFTVQTGGLGTDRFMALSAADMESLITPHIFGGVANQIDVIRSSTPTQWMAYTYTVIYKHQDVGGDVPSLTYVPTASSLLGQGASATVAESVQGTSIRGTFQLRFVGEITRPINHDASAEDVQDALNQLTSIAPSAVIVTRTAEPVMTGPSDGSGGASTQVGGYVWSVTFASNTWVDPTEPHDLSNIPGNWFGPAAGVDDTWADSGFSKAWGKNVGNVPMMECLDAGLSTTNGEFPSDGCSVAELVAGTDPLGGGFKLCLDTANNLNGVVSVEVDACTELIAHNAPASAVESGGDGSSMEEKLEALDNVGDVTVSRGPVNQKNGGYSWSVEFLRDADGPCQQKDDASGMCNSPGNVPKVCSSGGGGTPCDISVLSGGCERPGSCSKLVVLDATDYSNDVRPLGSADRLVVAVKDPDYLGWADGSVVAASSTFAEYKLAVDGIETNCIQHNAAASGVASEIQAVLDASSIESSVVKVERIRSEVDAPNGFLYYISIYDAGDVPLITASFAPGPCSGGDFAAAQEVAVESVADGSLHDTTCSGCVDGVVQRGDFTQFDVPGEAGGSTLPWNASPTDVASHIFANSGRTVEVARLVIDQYGATEWMLTFVGNPESTPPGAGDIPLLDVVQAADSGGTINAPIVSEVQKGSTGLSGSFSVDYFSANGPRLVSFDETAQRLAAKLSEMSTVGRVYVTRDCYPNCNSGGWGHVAVLDDGDEDDNDDITTGGYEWKIYFLENPGIHHGGVTFPPGSGSVDSPSIDFTALGGTLAQVESTSVVEGSIPLTGTFQLELDGEQSVPMPYAADSTSLEHALFDLSNTGRVSVETRDHAMKVIPNVLVDVELDGSVLTVQEDSDDLRSLLAPGDKFRVGGSGRSPEGEPDGAVEVGTAALVANSPFLTNTALFDQEFNVGEQLRIRGNVYAVVRNSVEVQAIAVSRIPSQADDYFYQIEVTINGVTETTACLMFDASSVDVQQALAGLSLFEEGDVIVSKSDATTGALGDAHIYRLYFVGANLLANLDQVVVRDCASGLPPGIDNTNSHVAVRSLLEGGYVEHQRIALSSDSGSTASVPAYQVTVYDEDLNSATSPCIEWGAPLLGLGTILDGAFSRSTSLTVDTGGVSHIQGSTYQIEASDFVQGTVMIGDIVGVGNSCRGSVVGFTGSSADGRNLRVMAPEGCSAVTGDVISIEKDAAVVEAQSGKLRSTTEVIELIVYADAEVTTDNGLFKLQLTHQGTSQTTSCIDYGASAAQVEAEFNRLFDYNLDGVIDGGDDGHVVVTRQGDGTVEYGFGYKYLLEGKGSPDSVGVSTVLGSGAPTIEVAGIGDTGGCYDAVDGGVPQIELSIIRDGADEYVYDVFFVGSSWSNVPEMDVTVFGDGACEADITHVQGGMNRNIAVSTILDGGGETLDDARDYVLDRPFEPQDEGNAPVYLVPPIFTVYPDTTEIQQIIIKDTDNTVVWGGGGNPDDPSFKLSYDGEATDCLSHQIGEAELETALNGLSTLCPSNMECVTVTKSLDAVEAPNGFLYTLYFNGDAATLNKDLLELVVDATHVDCTAFSAIDGESVEITTVRDGSTSMQFTASQLPLGSGMHGDSGDVPSSPLPPPPGRWMGNSAQDLSLYRITGTQWTTTFDDFLGDAPKMEISVGSLPESAHAGVFDDVVTGVNPTSIDLSHLETGARHFARVVATNEVGDGKNSGQDDAVPSDVPPILDSLSVGHALRVHEVQSLTIAASHIPEVQTIKTSAAAMPELQQVVLVSATGNAIDSGYFSLRVAEKQVVSWSAGSPVTAGSFFLRLEHIDTTASVALGSGELVTKELKTDCIPFTASAEDVQTAIEIEAIENGLGVGAVRVTRSGDRSYSSNFGYGYEIEFIGDAFRGNIAQMASDLTLSGSDAFGGSTCDSFESATNDAELQIDTPNDSKAIGTDTPRAQLDLDADLEVAEGQYQLSISYLGGTKTTACIPWDADGDDVGAALEALDNVDSVLVAVNEEQVHGISRSFLIFFDGQGMHTDGSDEFPGINPATSFEVVIDGSCDSFKAYSDNVLTDFSAIDDADVSITTPSTHRGGHTLSATSSETTPLDVSTSLLEAMHPLHFDNDMMVAQSLEDDGSGVTYTLTFGEGNGNVASLVCNGDEALASIPASCMAQTVMDGNVLSGYFYVGPSEPIPYDASAQHVEAVIEGMSGISNVHVSRGEADGQEGYTWTVTFVDDNGDVDQLIAYSSLQGKDASIQVTEVIKGNELGGNYTLSLDDETTIDIAYDADASDIEEALLDSFSGIDSVEVAMKGATDPEGGRSYRITFMDQEIGDVPLLQAGGSSLTGVSAVADVREVVKGSRARGDSLYVTFDMPTGCSVSEVPDASSCGAAILGGTIQADLNSAFIGQTQSVGYDPDYGVQIVRVAAVAGTFQLAYDDALTTPLPASASTEEVRYALEALPKVLTVSVSRSTLSGGYQWEVSFHKFEGGSPLPLTSPVHQLYPGDSTVEIRLKDCDKCMYLTDLSPWKQYYVRGKLTNTNGDSEYNEIAATATPMTVPDAPTDLSLTVISGECIELSFRAPPNGPIEDVVSYTIQYDADLDFLTPSTISIACNAPKCLQEVCGLDDGEEYFFKVAAFNSVLVQDNTNWSTALSAIPLDQAPELVTGLSVSGMAKNGLQVVWSPPFRDGGFAIDSYLLSWAVDHPSVEVSVASLDMLPDGRYVYNLFDASLNSNNLYTLSVQAKNTIGLGEAVVDDTAVGPSGPPGVPISGSLTIPTMSSMPITEATITWDAPLSSEDDGITGYMVEWWSADEKLPEIQVIKLHHTAPLSNTKFTLSYSPTPHVAKETAMLPWDASADLVRRELINLGYSEAEDDNLIQDVDVTRSTLTNGYAWYVTFGNSPDRTTNDGDIVALVGSVSANGDGGSPTVTITTTQDGRRAMGQSEVQFLQLVGTGAGTSTVGGFYRLKFASSKYTTFISAHADAFEIEQALEQLSTVGDVIVTQNDSVGSYDENDLIHHYEITFASNVGNVDRLVVDESGLTVESGTAKINVFDGDNSNDSAATPGEIPGLYAYFDDMDSEARSYTIPDLVTGREYMAAVSARNEKHGYGPRSHMHSGILPVQVPGKPRNVEIRNYN